MNPCFDVKQDNEKWPTVTQIIKKVTGKNFDFVNPKVLQMAIDRGNAIHAEIESGLYESPEAKWAGERINRLGVFETRLAGEVNGQWLSGKPDYIQDGCVYDWKTQSSPDLLSWTLQLSFYCFLSGATQAKVFHLPKNGRYRIFEIDVLSVEKLAEIIFCYRNNETISSNWLEKDGEKMENTELSLVVSTREIGKLTTNAKELKALIENKIKDYSADNYSEDNIADAKKDKADLNRVAKQINDEKIKIKKDFLKPIEEFEATVKETLDVIKTASGAIDDVVKAVEEREKETRRQKYLAHFESLEYTLIDFAQIYNPAWTNKTAKEAVVKREIEDAVAKVKTELGLLERLEEPEATALYLSTLNLELALNQADVIKENRRRLEEAKAEEAKAQEEPEPIPEPVASLAQEALEPEETKEVLEPEILTRTFSVWGTESQIIGLGEYMHANGIKFKKEA